MKPMEDNLANKSQSGVFLVDASIASLSGSSELLMAEHPSRGELIIQNAGSENIGVAFAAPGATATAAIGGAGTLTLFPGGVYTPAGGAIPLNAVYVIGTAGQPVAAYYAN